MLHYTKHNVLWKIKAMNKVIHFLQRALQMGTARNKWQNYALSGKFSCIAICLLGHWAMSFFLIASEMKGKTTQICLLQMFQYNVY